MAVCKTIFHMVNSQCPLCFCPVRCAVSHSFQSSSELAELLPVIQGQFLHCVLQGQHLRVWRRVTVYHFVRVVALRARIVMELTTIHFLLKLSHTTCTSNPVFQLRWHRVVLPHEGEEIFNHKRDQCSQAYLRKKIGGTQLRQHVFQSNQTLVHQHKRPPSAVYGII